MLFFDDNTNLMISRMGCLYTNASLWMQLWGLAMGSWNTWKRSFRNSWMHIQTTCPAMCAKVTLWLMGLMGLEFGDLVVEGSRSFAGLEWPDDLDFHQISWGFIMLYIQYIDIQCHTYTDTHAFIMSLYQLLNMFKLLSAAEITMMLSSNWPWSSSRISMRGLANVSLQLKWGLWKVACDAFPLCRAALDPDNDSWERWEGPAQRDPKESHEVILKLLRCHSRQIAMIPCWIPETEILFICPSTEVHWISDLSQLAVSKHNAQVRSSSWDAHGSFGGRQGIIIDYAMPKILGLSTLGSVKLGSLSHGRTWNPTYADDFDCKKHEETYEKMNFVHPCVVRRDWNYQWILHLALYCKGLHLKSCSCSSMIFRSYRSCKRSSCDCDVQEFRQHLGASRGFGYWNALFVLPLWMQRFSWQPHDLQWCGCEESQEEDPEIYWSCWW